MLEDHRNTTGTTPPVHLHVHTTGAVILEIRPLPASPTASEHLHKSRCILAGALFFLLFEFKFEF